MKLKGSKYFEVGFLVSNAKEKKIENSPIEIYLSVSEKDVEKVKADLHKKYGAEILEYLDYIKTLSVKIPAKNIRKAVQEDYVKNYEIPGVFM